MATIDDLISASRLVIAENRDFVLGMPPEWEGDPLQDAIANLAAVLEEISK